MTPAELKAARSTLNLSQSELAEAIGQSVGAVRHWEQGDRKIPGAVAKLIEMMLNAKSVE